MLRKIVVCFFVLICSLQLQAEQYFQKLSKFTTEHGIANNTILSIFQDSTGKMWFGTLEGLSSYNGIKFSTYSMADSLAGHPVTFIGQFDKDQLILGTGKGTYLFSISNKKFSKLTITNDNSSIRALFKIDDKTFFCTGSGIYEYKFKQKLYRKIFNHSITSKQKSPQGKILLGTSNSGVWEARLKSDTLILSRMYPKLENAKVKSIQCLNNGKSAILTDKGLWLVKEGDTHLIIEGSFSALSISQQEEILLGTFGNFVQQVHKDKGSYVLKDYINRDNEIFNDYYDAQINELFKDYSGAIWIGTNRAGLDRIDRKKITFKKYQSEIQRQEPEAGYINALYQNGNGKIWIGTSGKGLYYLDKEKEKLKPVSILQGNMNDLYVEAILQYKDTLYIGTRHMGIITVPTAPQFSQKMLASGQLFSNKAGLAKNDYIYALKRFDKKLHICSSKGSFVCKFGSRDITRIDSIPSINIKVDSLNNMWILSFGLELYCNQRKLELGTEVSDFYIGNNNEIWAATSKGLALIRTKDAKPEFYNPPEKVIEFTSMGIDKEGHFWLGSRMGIYRFDPKNKLFAAYQIPGGSKANSFNHGKILRSSEGEFYWGSNDGVVSILPRPNTYLSQPLFKVEQGTKEKSSVFKVHNYSFNHQEENGVAYRFSHPDSCWNYLPENQSVLNFSYLDKGQYQLEITVVNSDGIKNEEYKSFNFQIKRSLNVAITLWLVSIFILGGIVFWYWKTRNAYLASIAKDEEDDLPETPEDKIYKEWIKNEFMQTALMVIEEHLSDNSFGVNELYVSIQMSKSNFYRKLKKITNLSPNELIRFVRLRKSAQLLIEAKQSVNEIAYGVGFNSPSYFTRCFKQQFGIAPSEYKEYFDTLCDTNEKES